LSEQYAIQEGPGNAPGLLELANSRESPNHDEAAEGRAPNISHREHNNPA
jgi:hypothetical protein